MSNYSIFDFEKKIMDGEFNLLNTLKISDEFYIQEKLDSIERGFIKVFLGLIVLLGLLWLL